MFRYLRHISGYVRTISEHFRSISGYSRGLSGAYSLFFSSSSICLLLILFEPLHEHTRNHLIHVLIDILHICVCIYIYMHMLLTNQVDRQFREKRLAWHAIKLFYWGFVGDYMQDGDAHTPVACNSASWPVTLYTYICVCTYIFIYVYMYEYKPVWTCIVCTHIYIYTYKTQIWVHVYHTCIYVRTCITIYIYTYIYISLYIYIYVYICVYICIHMHIYMYICVYIQTDLSAQFGQGPGCRWVFFVRSDKKFKFF